MPQSETIAACRCVDRPVRGARSADSRSADTRSADTGSADTRSADPWGAAVAAALGRGSVLVIDMCAPATDDSALSDAERTRAASMPEGKRGLFAGARMAARRALAAWLDCALACPVIDAPGDAAPRVTGMSCGAPLAGTAAEVGISFSYADDRALVAIAPGFRVGIDVEALAGRGRQARRDVGAIRAAFFGSPDPAGADAPPEDPRAFLEDWTQHEAFVKATGAGLTFPAADTDPAEEGYSVTLIDVGPGHIAAVAARAVSFDVTIVPAPPKDADQD